MKARIEVNPKDELPKGLVFASVLIHEIEWLMVVFYDEDSGQWYEHLEEEEPISGTIKYWLKEVTLPDEDEIETMAWQYKNMRSSVDVKGLKFKFYCEFVDGAIWLLSKLK